MSRTANSVTLVCYDIASNRLRRKVEKCLKDFGVRLQYSVFLCGIEPPAVERMRGKLAGLLEQYRDEQEQDDSVVIFERVQYGQMVCLIGDDCIRANRSFEIL